MEAPLFGIERNVMISRDDNLNGMLKRIQLSHKLFYLFCRSGGCEVSSMDEDITIGHVFKGRIVAMRV